jgi:hypothetical protein
MAVHRICLRGRESIKVFHKLVSRFQNRLNHLNPLALIEAIMTIGILASGVPINPGKNRKNVKFQVLTAAIWR